MVKRGSGISGAELKGYRVIVELSPSFKSFASSCPCFVSSLSTLRLCDPFLMARMSWEGGQFSRPPKISCLLTWSQKISRFPNVLRQCAPIRQCQMSPESSPMLKTMWQPSEIVHAGACGMSVFLGTSSRSIDAGPLVEFDVVSPALNMSGIMSEYSIRFQWSVPPPPDISCLLTWFTFYAEKHLRFLNSPRQSAPFRVCQVSPTSSSSWRMVQTAAAAHPM